MDGSMIVSSTPCELNYVLISFLLPHYHTNDSKRQFLCRTVWSNSLVSGCYKKVKVTPVLSLTGFRVNIGEATLLYRSLHK